MYFPEDEIQAFREIYQRHSGSEISQQEADILAQKLLRLLELISKPRNYHVKRDRYPQGDH